MEQFGYRRRCKCPGHWRARRLKWRIAARTANNGHRGKHSVLCLVCFGLWKSSSLHLDKLQDWEPRRWKRAGIGLMFDRLLDGTLVADVFAGRLFSTVDGRGLPCKAREILGGPGGRPQYRVHRYLRIARNGRRVGVYRHNAIWMIAHGLRHIPRGYQVDHIGDPTDDGIGNLRLITSQANQGRWDDAKIERLNAELRFVRDVPE